MLQKRELEKQKVEFQALQAQINPHFLYNTLGTINSFAILKEDDEISEMTEALANMFRYSLQNLEVVKIDDELLHVKDFLIIQEHRWQKKIPLSIEIDSELLHAEIVKLSLQPLVENAIEHGFQPVTDESKITIRGEVKGDILFLSVEDNGIGMNHGRLLELRNKLENGQLHPNTDHGIGLLNVAKRTKLLFGNDYGIEIFSEQNKGTTIRMAVPYSFERMSIMVEQLNWVDEAWSNIKQKVERTSEKIGANFPHASVEGEYVFERPNWWTAAFWPGLLWQVYQESKDEKLKVIAEECEVKLDEVINYFYTMHHDIGFMWKLTSVARYKQLGDEDSKRRALMIAHILMGRFNANGNYIQAWNNWGDGDDKSGWSIIDTMMNLPLLYWASEETKNPRFKAVAMKHADTVLSHFIREDGAVHHIVEFDFRNWRMCWSYSRTRTCSVFCMGTRCCMGIIWDDALLSLYRRRSILTGC